MKDPTNSIIMTLSLIFLVLMVFLFHNDQKTEERVLSGEYQLVCKVTLDGYTVIDKDKVVERIGDAWIFTNGYSKTCKVIK